METKKLLLISLFLLLGVALIFEAGAQSRFDSGDSSDDISGSDFDSGDDSSRFDSRDDSSRFDSGSSGSDSSDESGSDQSSGNFDSGDDPDYSEESSSSQSDSDSSRFDSGDDSDDLGSSQSGSGDLGDSSSRFDSGDETDDVGDSGARFDSGDSSDDAGDNGTRFDSGDETDDVGDNGTRFDSGDNVSSDEPSQPEEPGNEDVSPPEDDPGDGDDEEDVIDFLDLSDTDISMQLFPTTVTPGTEVSVTGSVSAENVEELTAEVYLNGREVDTVDLEEDGSFSTVVSSQQVGENTVRVDVRGASQTATFAVDEDLRITRIVTSGEMSAGDTIQVCPQIESQMPAQISFYANNQLQSTTTGTGEVCFDAVLQEGANTFRVEATLGGATVTDTIVRNADGQQLQPFDGGVDDTPGQGPTGDFSSGTSWLPNLGLNLANLDMRWLISILLSILFTTGILV